MRPSRLFKSDASQPISRCACFVALVVALVILVAVMATSVPGCANGADTGQTPSTQPATTLGAAGGDALTTQSSSAAPSTTQPPATATTLGAAAGSPDSGDPYFPSSGNGGYEVRNYDIALDIDPVSGRIAGEEVVTAVALQDLSAFYLDLQGLSVTEARVDGATARFRQEGKELQVTSPAVLVKDARFEVTIKYEGVPVTIEGKSYTMGWHKQGDAVYTLDEPQGAATWFAVNDTPADKATYTFRLTVPEPYTAAATGILTSTEDQGAERTFVWAMAQPMASYLAGFSVDTFTLQTSTSAGGVPIRNYFTSDLASIAEKAFARTGDVIDYFSSLFGPYPFPVYGVVVPDAASGGAMENQTLSLFGRDVLEKRMNDPTAGPIYLSHELAHHWFGNSVTLEAWDDIWLNEGFATYASWLWLEHDKGRQALEEQVKLSVGLLSKSLEPSPGAPGPDNLFGLSTYQRGALTLHALRLTVGDEAFFSILRAWADGHKYGNADTADFIALTKQKATHVSPSELDELFQAWLYGEELPALPE